ncbi:TipC family immunity protein [Streptococcus sp. CSL10205-OR2]|uniref:TipC family immunity protein n=1 Tax=Streptococcus sp. CSL10205-OR2 TaxID=2980558 RepID=UPI0021D92F47|nr:TipC family immunity protein [Streptococcus sp. CSL10205-OR2]MCU9534074.1 TipC family immunity protein [Streptococcus sp. CSL10205-OR2]
MPKTNRIVIILISLLATIALTVTGLYYYNNRIQNIFDEMYYDTGGTGEISYDLFGKRYEEGSYVFGQFNDVTVNYSNVFDEEMNDTRNREPHVYYRDEVLPPHYIETQIDFNFFHKDITGIDFIFKKEIVPGVRVLIFVRYDKKINILNSKIIALSFEQGLTYDYLEEESAIKTYLKEHDISAKELDNIYDELMNDKILTDWTNLYDSQYSPNDYGNVKVVTQWENW